MRFARAWFASMCAVYAGLWLWSSTRLPERVPTHFGLSGQADQWSSRTGALLFTALLGLGTTLFFTSLVWVVNHASRPVANVPYSDYWSKPEHVDQMRVLVTEDLWLFGAWTFLLVCAIQVLLVQAAGMVSPAVGPWAAVSLGIFVGGLLLRLAWMHRRRYVPPRPPALELFSGLPKSGR